MIKYQYPTVFVCICMSTADSYQHEKKILNKDVVSIPVIKTKSSVKTNIQNGFQIQFIGYHIFTISKNAHVMHMNRDRNVLFAVYYR